MTPKQYIATLRRSYGCPAIEYQVSAWPWPQAHRSVLEIWLADEPREPYQMPQRRIRVPLVNADIPGAPIEVAPGAPRPVQVAARLRRIAEEGTSGGT